MRDVPGYRRGDDQRSLRGRQRTARLGGTAVTAPAAGRSHPIVGVGAVVVRPDGAVLIGHRIKQGEPASWCLPGGHVEAGENFEAAAVRETGEETGVHGVAGARVFTLALQTDGARVHVIAGVLARVAEHETAAATLEPEIFDRWVWARPEELPTPLFPASAALLAAWRDEPAPEGWTLYPTVEATPYPRAEHRSGHPVPR
ncbi:nucleotide triphosphate diphosphatase NUDT15 [Streptomyces phaeochromogenes]|uniref:nucleotide triphosphate diphosphatase NUDT15 n=1 Tax=Streptomyces phaeochromogenes TaxID=1923 RepID=UPI00371640D2